MPNADIAVLIDQTLSPSAQARMFADIAIKVARETQLFDERILGHAIAIKKFVDGVLSASEYSARINSVISYEFGGATTEALQFIGQELEKNSPVGSTGDRHPGQYQASHILFADGVLVPVDDHIPAAHEYLFTSTLPYSRRIEDGESSQAPSGVYELVANEAGKKFGDVRIEFVDYVGIYGVMAEMSNAVYGKRTRLAHNKSGNRYPAIRVTVN